MLWSQALGFRSGKNEGLVIIPGHNIRQLEEESVSGGVSMVPAVVLGGSSHGFDKSCH